MSAQSSYATRSRKRPCSQRERLVVQTPRLPAEFKAISDLIIKLIDLKVVQAETIGESLLPRVQLVEPAKAKDGAEGAGTQVE